MAFCALDLHNSHHFVTAFPYPSAQRNDGLTVVTLYHREGCHLCDDMLHALVPLSRELDFTIERVDIDRDPALRARYNEKVPVLMVGEDVVCCHFLDERSLRQALAHG